jgi:membrane fusion protein (multidrug efflux system)
VRKEDDVRAILIGCVLVGLAVAGAAYQYPELRSQTLAHLKQGIPGGTQEKGAKENLKQDVAGAAKGERKGGAGKHGGNGGGPQPVEAAKAESAKSAGDVRAIGSLNSDESVQIASEIAGRIIELPLREGEGVKEGDILVRLDEALVQAELADTTARYEFAKTNQQRAQTLARSGNVTERARDEANTNEATSLAAVELAKTRLSKHVIRAPFSGTVGLRVVSPGAYIGIGTPIVNLEKIDTLKVDFKLPELYLADIKTGQSIDVSVDALPGKIFTGEIYAINPHVDVNGRSLSIRARLANSDGVLRPGLFARILVKGMTQREVVSVPESAVVPRGGENVIFAIVDGRAVESKVKLGNRKAGAVEVLEGLQANAMVVTAGQQRLRNGSPVEIIVRQSDASPSDGG